MARFLITAGPTVEAIDPVRFLSNRSSGRMGYALAADLQRRGHEVILVSGPVNLAAPEGVRRIMVESALEMLEACQAEWPQCDGVIGVAAVADYRPKTSGEQKLKRKEGEGLTLELEPNPDILKTLAAEKGDRIAIGFALETHNAEAEAQRKLAAKNLDYLILNGAEAQGATSSQVTLFRADDTRSPLGPLPKEALATALLDIILQGTS
ncbi:MAG: phosphopantothenoylcysteine decarboxylase [Planctomycetota bacterium]